MMSSNIVITPLLNLRHPPAEEWYHPPPRHSVQHDELSMIAAQRNGTIQALLIDAAFVDYYAGTVSDL